MEKKITQIIFVNKVLICLHQFNNNKSTSMYEHKKNRLDEAWVYFILFFMDKKL